jgi:hypothetical protein
MARALVAMRVFMNHALETVESGVRNGVRLTHRPGTDASTAR